MGIMVVHIVDFDNIVLDEALLVEFHVRVVLPPVSFDSSRGAGQLH